jgi:hypothetical protein
MCRVADDKELKKHYVFAKASLEHPEVKDWVKAEGIRGIPHLSIYDGTGARFKENRNFYYIWKLCITAARIRHTCVQRSTLFTATAHGGVHVPCACLRIQVPGFCKEASGNAAALSHACAAAYEHVA